MMNETITVLTPTYNRANTLPALFESLKNQTAKDFLWLIIDDGSTDGTEKFFSDTVSRQSAPGFRTEYHRKENGGKHTALNFSHSFIHTPLTIIVDSDDTLLPDAIQTVLSDFEKFGENDNIGAFSYLRQSKSGTFFSRDDTADYLIDNDFSFRVNKSIKDDRCEVIKSDLLKKYPFPEFPGEKFMSEGWLWNTLAMKYNTVFRTKSIYVCEYLDDGLTKKGSSGRLLSPSGMAEYNKTFLNSNVKFSVRAKKALLFIAYSSISGRCFSDTVKASGMAALTVSLYPFGILLKRFLLKGKM